MEAIPLRLEVIALRVVSGWRPWLLVEAIALRVEAIASRLDAIALRVCVTCKTTRGHIEY